MSESIPPYIATYRSGFAVTSCNPRFTSSWLIPALMFAASTGLAVACGVGSHAYVLNFEKSTLLSNSTLIFCAWAAVLTIRTRRVASASLGEMRVMNALSKMCVEGHSHYNTGGALTQLLQLPL